MAPSPRAGVKPLKNKGKGMVPILETLKHGSISALKVWPGVL
jgi:hypothetical protein